MAVYTRDSYTHKVKAGEMAASIIVNVLMPALGSTDVKKCEFVELSCC